MGSPNGPPPVPWVKSNWVPGKGGKVFLDGRVKEGERGGRRVSPSHVDSGAYVNVLYVYVCSSTFVLVSVHVHNVS